MQKVLVSACLLGQRVRYDGADKLCSDDILRRWEAEGRVVPVCPEVAGGLPVPRPPAEIERGSGGDRVLSGEVRIFDNLGEDVSRQFIDGARAALATAQLHQIRIAILKEGSPSCGSSYSYDGTFSGTRVPVPGVTTALLRQHGILVFSEHELSEAAKALEEE